jgi:hypothetical protein
MSDAQSGISSMEHRRVDHAPVGSGGTDGTTRESIGTQPWRAARTFNTLACELGLTEVNPAAFAAKFGHGGEQGAAAF